MLGGGTFVRSRNFGGDAQPGLALLSRTGAAMAGLLRWELQIGYVNILPFLYVLFCWQAPCSDCRRCCILRRVATLAVAGRFGFIARCHAATIPETTPWWRRLVPLTRSCGSLSCEVWQSVSATAKGERLVHNSGALFKWRRYVLLFIAAVALCARSGQFMNHKMGPQTGGIGLPAKYRDP